MTREVPFEQPRIEQIGVDLDEPFEGLSRPPLAVDRHAPNPRVGDGRMELLRRTMFRRDLSDRLGNQLTGDIGIALLQMAPGELDVLAMAETLATREDLVQDRV